MKRTPDQLPDPWLFDSEALLKQLDRCRELVLRIPITSTDSHKAGQPNEKEISHGRVSLQTNWTYSAMGPLASSIG